MANKVNINEGRGLLAPVTGAHAERIRIGEPTHRDRLMAWVARNMGELLDEVQALRAKLAVFYDATRGYTEGSPLDVFYKLVKVESELSLEKGRVLGLTEGGEYLKRENATLRSELAEAHEALTAAEHFRQRVIAIVRSTPMGDAGRIDSHITASMFALLEMING